MARTIPLEDFFKKPERAQVRLSPDGRAIAFLAPYERRMNLHVRDLESGAERRLTAATARDIAGYYWAGEERIVYVQDRGGDENWRLYAVARDGGPVLDLTPFDGVQCRLVDDLEDHENEILFQMNRRDPQVFDLYRADVASGELTCVAENPGTIQTWVTDHQGRARAAVTTDGVSTSLLFRDAEDDPWRTVGEYTFRETVAPELFTFDDEKLWVTTNVGRDTAAPCLLDPATGEFEAPLYERADADVTGLLVSRARKTVTGVVYETDRIGYHFLDEARAGVQAQLDARFPGADNRVVSHDKAETRYVVHTGRDRDRGAYWLFDVASGELTHLFDLAPWLDPDELCEMRTIRYRARDGLEIQGYLTLPRGREAKGLPLLVHPHGGPWARDRWGWSPYVQFFANRGLAVLQVNFRGSTGRGRKFWEASFGEWGLKMQDDVTDGVQWCVDEGVADPARIAIFGGSYGGYATLSGLVKEPDLFACGISYVGVSNIFTWLDAFPSYWKPFLEMVHEMVGHPERDRERLEATSPFFHADKIQAPLLVLQGANDPRVRQEESDQIVAALRERNVPVDYLVKENEGHGFQNEENVFEAVRRMEGFLEEHLALTR